MKMQTVLLVLTFAVVLVPARGPAAEARMFEGVNLAALKQTQQLRNMPEIYELDPKTRRYQLREATLQIPLGEAWLTYNAELKSFYLNKVPGENAASYFGPAAGDVFEVFKLEERFREKLRKDYAGDELHRLGLMVRTGDAGLRARALRLMTNALADDVPASVRTYHLPRFKELAADMNGNDVAPLRAAILATEKSIEEMTVSLPDSDYSPGNEELTKQGKLQDWMKPAGSVPESAWGQALNGLRAGAAFSTTNVSLGTEISVWLLVENVSDKDIRFACSDVAQSARPKITRSNGKEIQANGTWYSGLSPILRYRLKPGERITVAKKRLVFDNKPDAKAIGFGGDRAKADADDYRVRYESVLSTGSAWSRGEDGNMRRTYPAKGEWSGWLHTGETAILVTP